MAVSFKELIEGHSEEKRVRIGDMVNATIIDINFKKKLVLVDGGASFKSESLISLDEFLDDHHLLSPETSGDESILHDHEATEGISHSLGIEIGHSVPVVVESVDNGYGETILSREKAKRGLAWNALQEALDNKTTVQGIVIGRVRGGFTVNLGILKGFLPGSLVDTQYLEEINNLTQQKFDFKVITLDYNRNNIVLSQGQVSREALLNTLQEGQIIKGYVKNLADYGAFINLGGIDGLLHNTDIAWEKTTAREKFKSHDPKDSIEVMILKIDRTQERPRISLGLKQLSEDPWMNLGDRYAVGMRLEKRKVTHIKEYGCFVEIEPGVEGLVHTSQMDWTNRNPNAHALIQKLQDEEGRIDVVILGIDVNLEQNIRRLSLGIKQCTESPWGAFSERYQEQDRIQGTIRSITDLGLFVRLEGNIDGLVHRSEISPDNSIEMNSLPYKKGDTIEVTILSIDPEREKVALSIDPSYAEDTEREDSLPTTDQEEDTTDEIALVDQEVFDEDNHMARESDSASSEEESIEDNELIDTDTDIWSEDEKTLPEDKESHAGEHNSSSEQ